MIITRTPLRISLGGGGTDLPTYYRRAGGFLVAAAISRYVYIAVHRNFDGDVLLKYSEVERIPNASAAQHPLLRESMLQVGVDDGVEISSMADIPAGTGLGSSGSFAVGLLRALHAHRHDLVTNRELAEEACFVEIDRLREPVGKQDQYIAAVGGVTGFEFHPDDGVTIAPVPMSEETRSQLDDNLLLFYTGVRRSASEVLAIEQQPSGAIELSENLDAVKQLGRDSFAALQAGDLDHFSALLTEQWDRKYERARTPVHAKVDEWIREGLQAGASGGKLVGAGGGGFLLFYADDKADLRRAMSAQGLEEVRFNVDYEGSTTIVAR